MIRYPIGVYSHTSWGYAAPGDVRACERQFMESATITDRTLEIDGMTGDACVQKVTGALRGVNNVTTRSVKVGGATIGADQVGSSAACAAIGTAGFKAREGAAGAPAAAEHPAGPKAEAGGATVKTAENPNGIAAAKPGAATN